MAAKLATNVDGVAVVLLALDEVALDPFEVAALTVVFCLGPFFPSVPFFAVTV